MRSKIIILTLVLSLFPFGAAFAQRYSVATNTVDWLMLGTLNADIGIGVSQHVSVHAGAELNPWTYNAGDEEHQFELRQNSYWAGARWWPWHVYSGWWAGADLRYSMYNFGGILSDETEEGEAYGIGAYGGYTMMLNKWINLDFGVGILGGYRKYTRYSCPVCGIRVENGDGGFILPDARVAIQFIF